jgi:hypothetical protein
VLRLCWFIDSNCHYVILLTYRYHYQAKSPYKHNIYPAEETLLVNVNDLIVKWQCHVPGLLIYCILNDTVTRKIRCKLTGWLTGHVEESWPLWFIELLRYRMLEIFEEIHENRLPSEAGFMFSFNRGYEVLMLQDSQLFLI